MSSSFTFHVLDVIENQNLQSFFGRHQDAHPENSSPEDSIDDSNHRSLPKAPVAHTLILVFRSDSFVLYGLDFKSSVLLPPWKSGHQCTNQSDSLRWLTPENSTGNSTTSACKHLLLLWWDRINPESYPWWHCWLSPSPTLGRVHRWWSLLCLWIANNSSRLYHIFVLHRETYSIATPSLLDPNSRLPQSPTTAMSFLVVTLLRFSFITQEYMSLLQSSWYLLLHPCIISVWIYFSTRPVALPWMAIPWYPQLMCSSTKFFD